MARATVRIGSRGSNLALVQAQFIKQQFEAVHPHITCRIKVIKTTGDQSQKPIHQIGGKGVFIKELEVALLNQEIDIAVHSFKDITAKPSPELIYSGFFLKERVTDAFIFFNQHSIPPKNMRLATGSLRRKALCDALYPNITCVPIRGNIQTRIALAKDRGDDGLILSTAGLQRLQLDHQISFEPSACTFIPAPGQGLIAIQQRSEDTDLKTQIQHLTDPKVDQLGTQYYRILQGIDFDCQLPLGVYIDTDAIYGFIQAKKPYFFTTKSVEDTIHTLKDHVQ